MFTGKVRKRSFMGKIINLFNHKGGVSKTTTVFNLAWMLGTMGKKVIVADFDPQCNLTGMVLGYKGVEDLEATYKENPANNVKDALSPAFESKPRQITGAECITVPGNDNLLLLPGHIGLAEYETTLGIAQELSGSLLALRNLPGSIRFMLSATADKYDADYVFVDMSPSLGPVNQNVLMTSDHFIVPLHPDYFSAMALSSLTRVLPRWKAWANTARGIEVLKTADYPFPEPNATFIGAVIQKYRPRKGAASSAFQHWIDQQTSNTAIAVIGIDIGKNSFHVVGHDARGAIVLRQKWSRGQVEARLANIPPCLIGMKACVGAHRLSPKLASLGDDARLMPAKYVRPYSKGQKNDFNDAEAIAEAVQRPTMKFVATKPAEQLDLQALHRVRERLVSQRTGIINQIRAFMLERGIAVRQGIGFLRTELSIILATRTDALSPRMLRVIEEVAGDWRRLDQRIDGLSGEIEALARQDQACSRLMTVPGIGPIISSAMVAAIGTGDVFSKGRDFGAWLGLVPKQISTGDRTILGKISRRGNRYLRVPFVQAAWVVLVRIKDWERFGLKSWIEAAKRRLHHNVLAIALANKLARIAWAVLAKGRAFELTKTDDAGVRPA